MKSISPLNLVHQKGKFGDHNDIEEKDLLKITEIKDVSIFQIVKFRNSKTENKIEIDNLSNLPFNFMVRIWADVFKIH